MARSLLSWLRGTWQGSHDEEPMECLCVCAEQLAVFADVDRLRTQRNAAQQKTVFQTTSPLRTDTEVTRRPSARFARFSIELRALESGYLDNIFVDEGQMVRKGQQMFQILPKLYLAELRKAQAEVAVAQIEYQNTKRLAEGRCFRK